LTKSHIFVLDWPELSFVRAELGSNAEKMWFSSAWSRIT